MEYRSEEHRLAVKAALLRITSDPSWAVIRDLADQTVYAMEQKALSEDDKEKREAFIFDARGARKFWAKWLGLIQVARDGEAGEAPEEVIVDSFNEVIVNGEAH